MFVNRFQLILMGFLTTSLHKKQSKCCQITRNLMILTYIVQWNSSLLKSETSWFSPWFSSKITMSKLSLVWRGGVRPLGLIHNWQNTVTTWIAKIGFRLETLEMIWASPLGKIVGLDDVIAFILLLFPPLQIGPSEPEGDLGRRSPHDFDKSVNLISIRGTTTVHRPPHYRITTSCHPRF
mgnify:CR=1 FL=1